jgi:alkanesulfonate monooxygenase SsuD/methylene tetrahydromethanopterin reductase-like flavin-dependent oxidoreductase (luciferase family)
VTSWLPRAGENYGLQQNVEHAERYRIADEFVAAVDALWRSFPGAAVVDDAESGQFLDIGQVRPVNYAGTHIRTRGPLNVPGSPQGRPVLVQAGQSETGRAFAAQWAEAIFTAHGSKESAQGFYADIKGQAKSLGRRAEDIVILPGISAAIGSTEYEARQVWEELDSLTSIDVGLGRLSARFGGHDFSSLPLDRR